MKRNDPRNVANPEWMTAKQLVRRGIITVAGVESLLAKMRDVQPLMPDALQMRPAPCSGMGLYLRMSELDKFMAVAGFDVVAPKTAEWLSATDLSGRADVPWNNKSDLLNRMRKLRDTMPDVIKLRRTATRTVLCLHESAIDSFVQAAYGHAISPKTAEWLSANELVQFPEFKGMHSMYVCRKLREIAPEMPNDIQYKWSDLPKQLCLRATARRAFLKHLRMHGNDVKTDEWMSVTEMMQDQSFFAGYHKIMNQLKVLRHVMPNDIQKKRFCNKEGLYLRRSALPRFLELSGFVPMDFKTDEWMNAAELANNDAVPSKTQSCITGKMRELQDVMPNDIRRLRTGSAPALCLRKSALAQFVALAFTMPNAQQVSRGIINTANQNKHTK